MTSPTWGWLHRRTQRRRPFYPPFVQLLSGLRSRKVAIGRVFLLFRAWRRRLGGSFSLVGASAGSVLGRVAGVNWLRFSAIFCAWGVSIGDIGSRSVSEWAPAAAWLFSSQRTAAGVPGAVG